MSEALRKALQRAVDNKQFVPWYRAHAEKWGLDPNPDAPEHRYDYRSAYAAGAEPGPDGHWPSEFKRKDHPNRFVEIDGVLTDTITGKPVRRR